MCGIFGIFNHPEASKLTYLGLYALQHRGQESAGIACTDGYDIRSHIQMGLVSDIFNKDILNRLKGNIAIGHVRYSTAGMSTIKNAQPLVINYSKGQLALAHNGNLINASSLKSKLEREGSIFQTTSDSEVLLHLIAKAKRNLPDSIRYALSKLKGAYSLAMMTPYSLIGIRDPWGVRPLCLGKIGRKGWVLASESCALDLINAEYVREIEPGEMVIISKDDFKSIHFANGKKNLSKCIFEFIYFSRPDSMIFGKSVYSVRKELGVYMAMEGLHKTKGADIVIAVPDSANSSAIGYSHYSKLPYEAGLIRNHYIGRTFIEPEQTIRDFGAKIKYNPVKDVLAGKNVIVIDDSIVRGTTSKKLIKMIRNAGAKQVHLAISSPPITSPCFYGIDTPTEKELIAANYSIEEIRKYLGVDSLHYLSLQGLNKATGCPAKDFCTACFTGRYKLGKC